MAIPRVPSDDMIDILSEVFYFFPEGKDRFNYNKEKFKEFFLRKKEEYPVLLRELKIEDYSNYTTTPKDILDIARDRMVLGKKLGYIVKEKYDEYIITNKCREYFEKEVKSKIDEKGLLRQVQELSKDFQSEFMIKE